MKILAAPYWPLLVITALMILAAVIDGWKFKVPNWLTMPMIVSGWLLALAYGMGWLEPAVDTPTVSSWTDRLGGSLLITAVAFITLGPFWIIGAMGAGDVKMQMGWGSWIGAFFGARLGLEIFLWGFVVGVLVGGVMGLAMLLIFREVRQGASNLKGLMLDLLFAGSLSQIQAGSQQRKPSQRRLPYGIPLCIGFVGYLIYYLSI